MIDSLNINNYIDANPLGLGCDEGPVKVNLNMIKENMVLQKYNEAETLSGCEIKVK